jgi:hypothetical protein
VATLSAAPPPEVVVLRQRERRGFAAAVNLGLGLSARDAVLLNSDTQVTAGWLAKLRAAARSTPDAGTVTPFTSHGSICSLPIFLAENTIPAGHTVDTFAALVERVSARLYPRLPTGVGFCLYVRRALLERVGPLDERFGLGYGEETDLCRRASAAGFVHLLDDATYVWHRGRASFGAESASLMERAEARMRRFHPDYIRVVSDFIREDPIAPARARVLEALAPAPRAALCDRPRRVLHLVDGWPPFDGAAETVYARGLARRQAAHREVRAYARVAWPGRDRGEVLEHFDDGVHVRLLVDGSRDRAETPAGANTGRRARRDFAGFLREMRPDVLHVHDLAGGGAALLWEAARLRVPIVYQLRGDEPATRPPRRGVSEGLGWLRALRRGRFRGRAAAAIPPGWELAPRPHGGALDEDAHLEEVETLYAEALAGRKARL